MLDDEEDDMVVSWIGVSADLYEHKKTWELSHRLGVPRSWAQGLVVRVWQWFSRNAQSGVLDSPCAMLMIESAVNEGSSLDPKKVVEAMVQCRFLGVSGTSVEVHDWADHAGKLILGHEKRLNRQRKYDQSKAQEKSDVGSDVRSAVSTDVQEKRREENTNNHVELDVCSASKKESEVEEVFRHWQSVMDHPKAKLDAKRKKFVKARLAEGHTVEDLKKAIDGCKLDKFYMGENDRKKPYNGIEVICRDTKHVEDFVALAEKNTQQPKQPLRTWSKPCPIGVDPYEWQDQQLEELRTKQLAKVHDDRGVRGVDVLRPTGTDGGTEENPEGGTEL